MLRPGRAGFLTRLVSRVGCWSDRTTKALSSALILLTKRIILGKLSRFYQAIWVLFLNIMFNGYVETERYFKGFF